MAPEEALHLHRLVLCVLLVTTLPVPGLQLIT
jgi:hypothetical protein